MHSIKGNVLQLSLDFLCQSSYKAAIKQWAEIASLFAKPENLINEILRGHHINVVDINHSIFTVVGKVF